MLNSFWGTLITFVFHLIQKWLFMMFFVFRLFVLSKVIFGVCNVIFWVEIFAPGANVEMLCPHAGGLYHHSPVPVKHGQVKHCKLFLSSYCLFVFSYFLSFPFSPQSLWNTANCCCLLIVFLSVCLFLFCLPIPCEPPMESETLQAEFCLFISVLMSFCLLAFLPFVPSPSSTTVKHCEQYQDGYLGNFFFICRIKKKVLMPIIRSFKLPEKKKKIILVS